MRNLSLGDPSKCLSRIYRGNRQQSSTNCAVRAFMRRFLLAGVLFAPVCVVIPGCATLLGGSGSSTLQSAVTGDRLPLTLPTQVFVQDKAGIADIYLTDLPVGELAGKDLSQLSGTIIHVHVFTIPSAGDTPIATTATTSTVRVVILANGQAGVYAGGGFFSASDDDASGSSFGGALRRATLYLRHATSGFDDRLGPSELSFSTSARRDEKAAATLAQAIDAVVNASKIVE